MAKMSFGSLGDLPPPHTATDAVKVKAVLKQKRRDDALATMTPNKHAHLVSKHGSTEKNFVKKRNRAAK